MSRKRDKPAPLLPFSLREVAVMAYHAAHRPSLDSFYVQCYHEYAAARRQSWDDVQDVPLLDVVHHHFRAQFEAMEPQEREEAIAYILQGEEEVAAAADDDEKFLSRVLAIDAERKAKEALPLALGRVQDQEPRQPQDATSHDTRAVSTAAAPPDIEISFGDEMRAYEQAIDPDGKNR